MVKVEVIWAGRGGFEDRDRWPPMIPKSLAPRKIVHACEAGEVAARDEAAPRDVGEVPRKLRPERRLQSEIFADADHPKIGKCRLDFSDSVIDLGRAVATDRDRQVVLAKSSPSGS